jgi:3-dehydroquinate synthase
MNVLTVRTRTQAYHVFMGQGLSGRLALWLRQAGLGPRLVIVTNPTVEGLYGAALRESLAAHKYEVSTLTMPDGENYKTLASAEELYLGLSRLHAERSTTILALGGGVVGDLAGYVAATYLRGIPLVQLPTTLLAQVDSSIGGKTGVDLGAHKNQVGAFYQPRVVFSDTAVLSTLPERELANGLAEVIKSAVVGDPALFSILERRMGDLKARDARVLAAVVGRAAAVKIRIVSKDEREAGLRQLLNFGHTVGHALETVTGFQLSHGEAVAAGMVAAGRLAQKMRLFAARDEGRLEKVIAAAGLPVALPPVDASAMIEAMRHDKKVKSGKFRFVLPVAIGSAVVREIEPALVAESLAA